MSDIPKKPKTSSTERMARKRKLDQASGKTSTVVVTPKLAEVFRRLIHAFPLEQDLIAHLEKGLKKDDEERAKREVQVTSLLSELIELLEREDIRKSK